MLQPLMVEPLLSHSILIVIASVTGGTQADESWRRIADIMKLMRSMQVNGIDRSCSSGETFRAIPDVASLAFPSFLLLALSC